MVPRRLLAILVTLSLALAAGVMSAQPAAAATPNWDTFPQAQRTTVSPEEVVFAPGRTGNVRVTITTSYNESPDWIYKSLRTDGSAGFYVERNALVGNLREIVVSADIPVSQARGYNYAYIIPSYVWKDAPAGSVYDSYSYANFPVYGQARLTLAGPARINPGTSLTLTGKLECFLRTDYGVPSNDWQGVKIEFREAGGSTWTRMGNATYNQDTGAFRYFNLAVGATGDWRAVNSSNTCTSSTSPLLNVVAGDAPPPPPPATSNAPAMRVSAKTHNTVSLSWSAPTQPGGAITGYRFGWESENGLPVPEWSRVYTRPSNPFVMTNLAPESNYSMWIEAITAAGTGARTTIDVTTNAAPPPPPKPPKPVVKAPSAPRAVKAYSVKKTSAKVKWVVPASNGGSRITGYQVKRSGASAKAKSASARSHKFTGLKKKRTYYLSVRAKNAKGYSSWVTVRVTTKK